MQLEPSPKMPLYSFMLGNEAIARGAMEAGVRVAAAYPGTPSTEIAEALIEMAKRGQLYAEWSVNEKVAFGVAMGASLCRLRSLAVMKHVGVNVASDLIMTATYLGTEAGLVLVEAEDPGQWSSSDEQDNRYFAEEAYLPVLEPSSPQEAKDMARDAFALSERFHQPFMIRSVTRIGHARSDVELGEIPAAAPVGKFSRDPSKLVMLPASARKHRRAMAARLAAIAEAADTLPYNQLSPAAGARLGIITSGISYAYVQEALNILGLREEVSVLKIGTPYPLPAMLVGRLLQGPTEVLVVEELEPFLENHVRAIAQKLGIAVKIHGKSVLPLAGELSTRLVVQALASLTRKNANIDYALADALAKAAEPLLPLRPPSLCAGCPHRASHYAINEACRRIKAETGVEPIRPGDIGCYCLGANPPLSAVDTSTCMGSGFDLANGIAIAQKVPVIAHLGDSTFFHSGIAPMVNAVFNNIKLTMVVMDNLTTAMTGSQVNPGTGTNALAGKVPEVRPEEVARACGIRFVEVSDPYDLESSVDTLLKAVKFEGPSLVVFRSPCSILEQREKRARGEKTAPLGIDQEKCLALSPPFCTAACPLQVDARGYVQLVREGKFDEALSLIQEKLPFPGILGRICTHPCEQKCKRAEVDEAISIMGLKRVAAELGKSEDLDLQVREERKEKVAVVGGGPAGLMASYELRRRGYQVTLFEAGGVLGGMLSAAIPEYRLPRAVTEREIARILKMGIEVKLNRRLGSDLELAGLKREFKGIVLALGAQKARLIGLEKGAAQGIVSGIDFLRDFRQGKLPAGRGRVLVLGGGNVAIDCARSCLRLGYSPVTLGYRRSRAEMPALAEEIREAENEGVRFEFLATPQAILAEAGILRAVKMARTRLGEPDASGRRQPIVIEGSEFEIGADLLIVAAGEEVDSASLRAGELALSQGFIQVQALTLQTSLPGVFAAGDVRGGPATVVNALADGRRAAISLDRYLRGEDLEAGRASDTQESPLKVDIRGFEKAPRAALPARPLARRTAGAEVVATLDLEDARKEAARCLACGCQICVKNLGCPAISVEGDQVLIDGAQCPGCGLCATICPAEAIGPVKSG